MISLLWKNFEGRYDDENNIDVESIMDLKVFDDLKIRRVLENIYDMYSDSDEVIDIMCRVPSKETVIYRREIMEDFFSSKDDIVKVYYKLVDIVSRYNVITNASERIKKRFLTVFYNFNLIKFFSYISDFINQKNYKSMCMIKIKNDINEYINHNQKFIDETNKLYEELVKILNLTCEYHDGSPYVTIDNVNKENLEDKLLSISNKLNINIDRNLKISSRKEINAYFLLEILKDKETLKNTLFNYYDKYNNNLIDLSKYVKELKYYVLVKLLFDTVTSLDVPKVKCEFNDEFTSFKDAYDISLCTSNIKTIPNDFNISDSENVQFILGVNSGGKTCYLRSIGINYILALTTGYAFAKEASVMVMKYINTHFPNEENYKVGEGRLVDEINRLKVIENTFSRESISFLNETFSSTSEEKACNLTFNLLEKCEKTKAKVLFVTHQYKIFDEIHQTNIGFFTPVVTEGTENVRTYKIKKVEKKLLSYVNDILKKYGLTKEQLLKRKKI
ncbi:MAG: hypothetical protein MRZ09_06865 [Coprobacillus sp.]|nr:hypothetical protein [Coprobacillus sp.]